MSDVIRILCVDDERAILNVIRRQLDDEDYEIHTALSADEGFEILRSVGPVHIVLSDYRMSGMNGIEFLKCVAEHWPDAVRIIISGFADTLAVKQAIDRHDLFAFLPKPWKAEEMRRTLSDAVAFSLTASSTAKHRQHPVDVPQKI